MRVFVLLGLHAGNWYSNKETTQLNTLFNYKENGPCFYYYYYELALPLVNELEKRLQLLKRNRIRTSAAFCGVHHTCKSIH
jgi:hypothetical protein